MQAKIRVGDRHGSVRTKRLFFSLSVSGHPERVCSSGKTAIALGRPRWMEDGFNRRPFLEGNILVRQKGNNQIRQERRDDDELTQWVVPFSMSINKGEIRRETRKRPGVRPSPVYSPEDLDRVKAAQVPQVVVMPPQAEAGGVPALAPRALELPSFLQSLVSGADVPLRDKLFLTVKEAVRFSGLPKSTIRRLLRSGKLPRLQSGRVEDSPGGPRRIGL